MAKGNTIRRVWWLKQWHIEETQTWLSDMAAQGWHLVSSGSTFAVFSKEEPRQDRYRCDVFRSDGTDFEDRIDLYRSAGWEYVDSRGIVHIFRAPEDSNIPELHTDPQEYSLIMSLLLRRLVMGGLGFLIWMAWLFFWPSRNYDNLQLLYMLDLTYHYLAVVPVLLLHVYSTLSAILRVSKLRAKLRDGHHIQAKPYRRTLFWSSVVGIWILVILLVSASQLARPQYPPIPEGELPVLRMSELFPGEDLEYQKMEPYLGSAIGRYNPNFNSYYRSSSSILVPDQWYLREKIAQPSIVSLDVSGYRARTKGLAKDLADLLVTDPPYWGKVRYRQMESVTSQPFDAMWQYEGDGEYELIALQGVFVFRVIYSGAEPTEKLVNLVQAKMDSLENK